MSTLNDPKLELEEARVHINHLEAKLDQIENQPLSKRAKGLVKDTARSTKNRVKRRLEQPKAAEWQYTDSLPNLITLKEKDIPYLLKELGRADKENYIRPLNPGSQSRARRAAYVSLAFVYHTTRKTTLHSYKVIKRIK